MKKITILLVFISTVIIQGCANKDCEDILCFTPPETFIFELVDKSTGENLFSNETYDPNNLEILNVSDNSSIDFLFIDENEINFIQIGSIGWKSEIVECSIRINDSEIFGIYVDAKRLSENCCSFTRYDEFRIDNTEFEYKDQLGIFRILID